MTDAYDMGDLDNPDPVAFGKNVADFDIGEPMGSVVDALVIDTAGIGWWGSLTQSHPLPTAWHPRSL